MCKRVMIGLFAMSVVAMWWTEADAATCLQWKVIGGSKVCTKWSTKGVLLTVIFHDYDGCSLGEQDCDVEATAEVAESGEEATSVAFCKNIMTGKIRRVDCFEHLSFSGHADCEPGGDDPDENICTATTMLKLSTEGGCKAACDAFKEEIIDVTPITMDTSTTASIGGKSDFATAQEQALSSECPMNLTTCTIKEHCTIDPKKIKLNEILSYQCTLQEGGGE